MQFDHKHHVSTNDLTCIHELFEQRAALAPDARTVHCGDQAVTYRELNERANRLAHHLRDLGIGPDARVAIVLSVDRDAGCSFNVFKRSIRVLVSFRPCDDQARAGHQRPE